MLLHSNYTKREHFPGLLQFNPRFYFLQNLLLTAGDLLCRKPNAE
jgi:hypothetical protein